MRCAPRASNGPNHLGLCALQIGAGVVRAPASGASGDPGCIAPPGPPQPHSMTDFGERHPSVPMGLGWRAALSACYPACSGSCVAVTVFVELRLPSCLRSRTVVARTLLLC